MSGMRARLIFAAVLLLSLPLTAAMQVVPAAPTSATSVTLGLQENAQCPRPDPVVSVSGTIINIEVSQAVCGQPPQAFTDSISLGTLTPGDYQVIVTSNGTRIDYGGFFVADANPHLSFTGPSIGSLSGFTPLILNNPSNYVTCFSSDQNQCPLPFIRFDHASGLVDAKAFANGIVSLVTPPTLTPGIVDVAIFTDKAQASGFVFRYYDPNAAPLPSMFERVLVPVYLFSSGAFGSQWVTDLTILNTGSFAFQPYRLAPQPSIPNGKAVPLNFGQSRPAGALFFVPRENSATTSFGCVVRDVSRSSSDAGTEVHVARESDFHVGSLSLLNVPVDPAFRDTLRIYGVDSVNDVATVTIYPMDSTTAIASRQVSLISAQPCERFNPCASDEPAYAQEDLLTLFPEAAGQSHLRIDVQSGSRMYSLLTVTNNVTQHVTVITPQ